MIKKLLIIPFNNDSTLYKMNELTFQSDKATLYSKILRSVVGLIGFFYMSAAISEIVTTPGFSVPTVINIILGGGMLALSFFNTTLGAKIELAITDEFLRSKEDKLIIRTAYWNRLERIVLTKFSVRLKYESGTTERFRLPYLEPAKFKDLKHRLRLMSIQHTFQFEEKRWWKIF